MAWKCLFCAGFTALYLSFLLTHLNSMHGDETNFEINCGLDDCDSTFSKTNTFVRHVQNSHRNLLFTSFPVNNEGPSLIQGIIV